MGKPAWRAFRAVCPHSLTLRRYRPAVTKACLRDQGIMTEIQEQQGHPPSFRLDVQLHDLLMQPAAKPSIPVPPKGEPQKLPEPVFPQHPDLMEGEDADYVPKDGERHWTGEQILHSMRGWMFP